MANIIEILIKGTDLSAGAFNSSIKGLSSLTSALTVARGAMAGLIGVGGIGALAKQALDMGESLSIASKKTGMSVEALSRLSYAASLDKVAFEDLETGMRKMAKAMVAGDEAFKALGVRVKDSNGNLRPMEDVFLDVADAMSKYGEGAG